MGEFSWGRLPTSILFLTGGGAGLYVGGALPTPVDVIVKAASVAALGWGVYYLFNEPATPKTEKPAGATQEPQHTPTPGAFQLIKGAIISPISGTVPSENFWTRSFDAQVAWYNGSSDEVHFTYDVLGTIYGLGRLVEGENLIRKSLYRGTVKLAPNDNSGPLTITIPILQPPKAGLTGFGPSTFKMDLQLRKYDSMGNPIPTGDPVTVGPFPFS